VGERLVAMEFGAVADKLDREAIADIRQQTHDGLLAHLQNRLRRSGVSWYQVDAREREAVHKLVTLGGTRGGPDVTQLLAFLEENPGGALIVATCAWEA
jgi:hypothetical protein